VAIVLAAVTVVAGIWLLRLAISERVSLYPAPRLGRAAIISLALICFATALSASVTSVFQGELNPDWALRLYYGVIGILAAFMCVAVGFYALALAPGAYQRQHPQHPSEFGAKATAAMGRVSGLFLIGLGLVAIGITGYLVVVAPGL
jgi:hypothetical protein